MPWRGKAGWVPTRAGLVDGGSGRRGKGSGGVQGLRFRGDVQKKEKLRFLKDGLWGGGVGYPPELAGSRDSKFRIFVVSNA